MRSSAARVTRRPMSAATADDLKLLFLDARTHNAFAPEAPDDATLTRIYELVRMGPTSMNCQPLRVLYVKGQAAKEKLRPTLSSGNVDKTMAAPVTAILAWDTEFHEQMAKLWTVKDVRPGLRAMPPEKRAAMGLQSGTLQAGYFILAARSLGLDCGPMGGFDAAKVDQAFFPDGKWRSMLLVNLGHGDASKLHPRLPRLDFSEACRVE